MKENKRTFLLSYLVFISAIILFIVISSILGNIERVGYLSNFNHILENKYYFTLKFNSSIFKNNKIYRVYPNTNEMPDNVTNIKWSGSYYGNLVLGDSSIQLKENDKIENIKYTVKIQKNVFLFLLFLIIVFPAIYFYVIPNIYYHHKSYIFFFVLNSFLYLITSNLIMPLFSMMKLDFNIYDFLYTYLFVMTAYNLLAHYPFNLGNIKNIRIILTSLFCVVSIFSFFVIESISLTVLNMVILFSDMPNLYSSLITVLPIHLKIITITVSIIYFSSLLAFVILFIFNIYKMFIERSRISSLVMIAFIIFTAFYLFLKPKNIDIWSIDFVRNAKRNGIINTLNYRINYDRLNEIKPSKELVSDSIKLLKEYESKRDVSKLYLKSTKNILNNINKLEDNMHSILMEASSKNNNFVYNNENIDYEYIEQLKNNNYDIYTNLEASITNDLSKIEELKKGLKRDVYLIFLESFYDYSHFRKLFNKDPFPKEYRKWADSSRKIAPNVNNGSFYARLSGLTGSSPLYPKTQSEKIENTLPDILSKNGYNTIALEEALNTYNLKTFYPSIGFKSQVFGLGTTNINTYLSTNIDNLESPVFAAGFTILGHTDSHLSNDLNFAENNKKFLDNFEGNDKLHIIETIDNSAMTAINIIDIRDTILKHSPNAIIIFKHDHLYPYLKAIIERSTIDEKIKTNFLNDYKPSPILIWDGTNGAYKVNENFTPENIPLFIAVNLNIDYTNSVISLLYKEEIDNTISTYNRFYYTTNDSIIDNSEVSNMIIFKYENAQRILSQDIFQGKKHYYNLIKELTNN
ncbi:hypothetical protein OFR22_03840 [Brachyspira hyodysenteriae]|uniref:hypothetical protein n=1 Tax=Brachyspira hyodysenteriae TaxID=159 RepID=UPI0022CD2D56|nr:hypothetical protein [Brachyspira hyodysenteriae]MCZ9837854.1 hypothetical protein [Brachyspira hyodysenteriae]MCZ9848972.1 hypothetical protein [Brachyspira hyodysenteriae]MCZ9871420.1 hypothetical protein [Brachyspira hyodysenteriae]MCZ9874150.1 hypothetical protein [Brachyspira hyodysenteriae]MCZ9876165.1 hypothetical protein [Brachyspira hyodysenteriae]